MTEDEARQVLLLQAHEPPDPDEQLQRIWTAEDRAWATRQAVAVVGERADPERFVVARAAMALQRLLPRNAAAQRWIKRRAWHPVWILLALLLGLLAGVLADQLGPPQRVNLLAPAVWAVVLWNLLVYLSLAWPGAGHGLRNWLARNLRGKGQPATALWASHSAPLGLQRVALLLHLAAAALALGLMAGLYLRGLVLDYRAGWQSTFLDSERVQWALNLLLAPASALSGIAVPEVAPLRLAAGQDASASAAAWIHLLAATLLLWVVLPRLLLAAVAHWRARALERRFPLQLNTRYFEGLHPLMRPGLSPSLRLLWVNDTALKSPRLFGHEVGELSQPLTLVHSEEGDRLELHPLPQQLQGGHGAHVGQGALVPAQSQSWWQRLWGAVAMQDSPVQRLRADTDVVLLLLAPGAQAPAWLEALERPMLVLVDMPEAEPPRLSLQARDEGWLPEGRLLSALDKALPDDPRLLRLRKTWQAQQLTRLGQGVSLLSAGLGRIAATHAALADDGMLARRAESEVARAALAAELEAELRRIDTGLADWLGRPHLAGDTFQPIAAAAAAVHGRVGEGRAAILGGVVTGALAGLKADVLSGGLTMGAGLLTGGVLGALGGAGVARGINVVRGTDRSFAAWGEESMALIVAGMLQRFLVLAHEMDPQQAQRQLAPALADCQPQLTALWAQRQRRLDNEGEAQALAPKIQPLLLKALRQALGGP